MVKLESKLKEEEPVWDSWKAYTGNFWNDCKYLVYVNDKEGWMHCFNINPKKALKYENELIDKVLPNPYSWLNDNQH
jgi:hypothetical protein